MTEEELREAIYTYLDKVLVYLLDERYRVIDEEWRRE